MRMSACTTSFNFKHATENVISRSFFRQYSTIILHFLGVNTGLYTKWDSFTPRKYKINPIRTLTFRCFRICSSSSLLRSSLSELRKLLSQNGYPAGIVNYNINDVLNRQQNRQREQITTVPKKEIQLILPFLGLQSNVITKQLKACINDINKFYECIDLRVIFQSNQRIKSFFPYKDKLNRSQI